MGLSNFKLRIDGTEYTLRFTKERQFLNGEEELAIVHSRRSEILLSSAIREVIAEAVSTSRQSQRTHRRAAPAITPKPVSKRPLGPIITFSGCFPVHRQPWDWE